MTGFVASSVVIVVLALVFTLAYTALRLPPNWAFAAGVFTGMVAEGIKREIRSR